MKNKFGINLIVTSMLIATFGSSSANAGFIEDFLNKYPKGRVLLSEETVESVLYRDKVPLISIYTDRNSDKSTKLHTLDKTWDYVMRSNEKETNLAIKLPHETPGKKPLKRRSIILTMGFGK